MSSSGVEYNSDGIFGAALIEEDGCIVIFFVVAVGDTTVKAFDVHDAAASNSNIVA